MHQSNSGDIDFSLCKAWVYAKRCRDIFMVKPKACMQTFEKTGANFRYFTQVGANLKKILMFGKKIRGVNSVLVKNCIGA